ncbi:MAG TPA: hypothetical protein VK081_09195 [Planctomycetota bacterium]|nr:hypothetical protein [Planctomycetota bacterium]
MIRLSRLLVLSFAAGLAAQDAPPPADAPKPPSWPKLKTLEAGRVDQLLENFKLDNPALHEKSIDELAALGAGIAPRLIAKLSDRSPNDHLLRALARVTTVEHAALIAAEAGHKTIARRRWSIGRLVEVAAPDAGPVYQKALADKDEEVAYRAAVGLASLGDPAGMDKVFERVKKHWADCRQWLEPALARGRSEALSAWLCTKLESGEFADKVAALRLFRSAGVRADAGKVAVALDSSDHGVKKEAINALRVVVLDQPPLDDLSVFQSIEMAKEIKSKL